MTSTFTPMTSAARLRADAAVATNTSFATTTRPEHRIEGGKLNVRDATGSVSLGFPTRPREIHSSPAAASRPT